MGPNRRTFIATLLAVCALISLAGCAGGRRIPQSELNVLLVTIDTVRPGELGCYGSKLGITPQMDALARQGILFENVVTAAPMTTPSHATILTGLYPFHHGIRANGFYTLAQEHVTLAERLQAAGLATGAVVGAYVLDHSFQLNQGFETYDDDLSRGFQKGASNYVERAADDVTMPAVEWLRGHRDRRFFLWVHYFDAHSPYEPPAAYARYGTDDLGRYRGEIAYVDANVGKLVAVLKETKLYDRTAIVVVADHGEAFGEHGEFGHGLWMYDSTVRVPLIVRLPRVEGLPAPRGRRVGGRASLADITPTILDLAGVEATGPLDGRSLLPSLEGEGKDPNWRIYAETAEGKLNRGWSQLSGIYSGRWKYILAPRPELYDLAADPGEERNLAANLSARADEMKSELVRLASRAAAGPGSSRHELDQHTVESLRSLGYLTGAAPPKADILLQVDNDIVAACTTGHDPKDMVESAALINRGVRYMDEHQPQEAIRVLRQAEEKGSDDVWLWRTLGEAYTQLQMYDSALVAHEKALALLPEDASTLNSLGVIYDAKGDLDRAEGLFQRSIAAYPNYFRQHLNLATVYHEKKEYARADSEFAVALALAPAAGGAREEVRYKMAYSFYRRGRLAEARQLAEQVLATDPQNRPAQGLLRRLNAP